MTLLFGLAALPASAQEPETTLVVLADLSKVTVGRPAPVYATAAGHAPDRVIWLGDRDHRFGPNAVPSRAQFQKLHCEVQGLTCSGAATTPAGQDWQASGLAQVPQTVVGDDHEIANNVDKTHPSWPVAIEEHQLAYPAPYVSANGNWHTRIEGSVRIIALDTRSRREPFGIDGPTAMLGPEQQAWFEVTLIAAAADLVAHPWIVILSSVPLAPDAKPLDAWASKPVAQATMEALLLAHCQGRCIVWGADMHTGGGFRLTAWGVEMTNSHANLGNGIHVWGSCVTRAGCGYFWDGLTQGRNKPGFGVLRATAASLTAEIRGVNDVVRWSVTLP